MDNDQNLACRLKQVFLMTLMQALCEFLPPVFFVAGWLFAVDAFIDALYLFYFGRILFPAVCGVSLYRMGKEIGACRKAAVLCFADVSALVIRFIVHADKIDHVSYIMYFAAEERMCMYDEYLKGAAAWIDLIAGIVHHAAPLLVAYFVCTSVAAIMKGLDAVKIAKFAQEVWVVYLVTGILYMIVLFLPSSVFTDWCRLAIFVASVIYLRLLSKSYRTLDAQKEGEEK
ncbi:MAG: hypothetical protein K2O59_08930 [Lachnospiraceae bacterium]|nr:hypothetical protein [Lachnospiraceae bacterium]